MSRTKTGYVAGGMQSYVLPTALDPGEIGVHAVGRVNTMAEILVHAACLKSKGYFNAATSYEGADFQDVTGDYSGTNKIAAAHRAMFSMYLDGRNTAKLTQVEKRALLKEHVIAPQARTDLVSRAVNYADQLLEIAAGGAVFRLFKAALDLQKPGKAVEKMMLQSTVERMLKALHDGFQVAGENFHRAMIESDRLIFRPGMEKPLPEDTDLDELFETFEDRLTIQINGAKKLGNLTEVVLGTSQQVTDRTVPDIEKSGVLDAMIDTMDALAR